MKNYVWIIIIITNSITIIVESNSNYKLLPASFVFMVLVCAYFSWSIHISFVRWRVLLQCVGLYPPISQAYPNNKQIFIKLGLKSKNVRQCHVKSFQIPSFESSYNN
jgi:hypothetical protein